MKTPESLETLVDHGIIQEVVRPLMSGKEAQVYVVIAGGQECVAKVYKEAHQRTFKHRVEYTEGRRTRNTRDQRAIQKRTRHGRKQDENAWRSAEVDTIHRLRDGGVRVPEPLNFVDGVLIMELVKDAEGHPAARLGDLDFTAPEAEAIYRQLIREVVRMLCAGVIHGDLSEFNVLMAADGPVVIDFPQSVDPAKNQSARKLLLRDVENLHRFLSRYSSNQPIKPYGEEMWSLYEKNKLRPDTELGGDYRAPTGQANLEEVLALIEDANQDEQLRRDARGDEQPVTPPPPALRRVVDFTQEAGRRTGPRKPGGEQEAREPSRPRSRPGQKQAGPRAPDAQEPPAAPRRRARPKRPASAEHRGAGPPSGPRSESRGPRSPRVEEPGGQEKAASTDRERPKRRRRGRRSAPRAGSDEKPATPRKPSSRSESRSARGASADEKPPAQNDAASPRPRRRRRRGPRSTDTRPV